MKRNDHVVVPRESFKLLSGQDSLSTYTFNTHKAKHYFCKTCGVQSYYVPRSNPNGIGVTFTCIKNYKDTKHRFDGFDGINWEKHYENSEIKQHSGES
jgi:hypothetical protein